MTWHAVRVVWAVVWHDLLAWLHSPWSIVAALLPPLGMGALLLVLAAAVGKQPVALVVEDSGPAAEMMAQIFRDDREAYQLKTMSLSEAHGRLDSQQIAAIIEIPPEFGQREAQSIASVRLILNNVNLDVSDDLRRTVTRSIASYDAVSLGPDTETVGGGLDDDAGKLAGLLAAPANPYRISIDEHDLRRTTVSYDRYQLIPILILIVVNVGMLGTALLCSREFETRTAKLFLLAPVSRITLATGKLLGGMLATSIVLAPVVAVAAARHVLDPPRGHWPTVLGLLVLVSLFAAGAGLVLGAALRQGRLVTMVGLNLATVLFFLGGGFTTVAFLPGWLQSLSALLPTRYAIDGLRQTLFYPNLTGVARDLFVLCGSALAAALLGTRALTHGWRR